MTTVIDAVSAPPERDITQIAIDYATTGETTDEGRQALFEAGLVFDVATALFTEAGLDLLEDNRQHLREIQTLRLGQPVSFLATRKDTGGLHKVTIEPGSQFLVVWSNVHEKEYLRKGILRLDVYVSPDFPALRIAMNSKHKLETHRWPLTWKTDKLHPVLKVGA